MYDVAFAMSVSPSARITILQPVLLHGSMSAVLTLSSSLKLWSGEG
jgi:hypothetical protein